MTLEEMGLYGTANVVEIDPCAEIQEGSGRVVLATITHDNSATRQLRFEGSGLLLEPTDRHRLYSVTRAAWTPAEELQAGEVLITRDSSVRIAANERSEVSARVYNLQVETEECYYVTSEHILSHNTNPCAGARKFSGVSSDELVAAGNQADKGGLTKVGRALQKHGSRSGSSFPAAKGNVAAINGQGEAALKSILNSPDAASAIKHHAKLQTEVLEVRLPNGQGARFSSDGKTFIGFLEPY